MSMIFLVGPNNLWSPIVKVMKTETSNQFISKLWIYVYKLIKKSGRVMGLATEK